MPVSYSVIARTRTGLVSRRRPTCAVRVGDRVYIELIMTHSARVHSVCV